MKTLTILTVLGIFLLAPLYACSAQEGGITSIPSNFGEAKDMGRSALKAIPHAFRTAGQEGMAVVRWIWGYMKSFAVTYIEPTILRAINWLKDLVGKEVEQKKPEVKKELQRETEEMREKIPTGRSLWERIKSLFY